MKLICKRNCPEEQCIVLTSEVVVEKKIVAVAITVGKGAKAVDIKTVDTAVIIEAAVKAHVHASKSNVDDQVNRSAGVHLHVKPTDGSRPNFLVVNIDNGEE